MSVFEKLIEELKEENLIEESVLETGSIEYQAKPVGEDNVSQIMETADDNSADAVPLPKLFDPKTEVSESEFYRRRAMEEVSSLQMVERILSGVEREQLKISPTSYDDIAVSTALHEFLKVSKNSNSPDNVTAEFNLMQETENWYTALSHRDRNIIPAQLRRYCETTRPVLSPQALAALARFYRNSPFSDAVRSKFDMVITRLFSHEKDDDKRELAFEYDEIAQHLSELYADWSSVLLYADDDDSKIRAITKKFEEFITEADAADEFEDLVKSNFFNRLRLFKESTGENFYAPSAAAAGIKCNVRVGNVYVELLNKERIKSGPGYLEYKYSNLLDQVISEAAGKTLQLTNLLEEKKSRKVEAVEVEPPPAPTQTVDEAAEKTKDETKPNSFASQILGVNKWLLGATILSIVLAFGFYSFSKVSEPQASTVGVQNFDVSEFYFKEYLKSSKINGETLFCIVNQTWADLTEEKKKEILKNMKAVGKTHGFKIVRLQSQEGKTIGYATDDDITTGTN